MKKIIPILTFGLTITLSSPAFAGDLREGLNAFAQKDFATASQILPEYADQGNAQAASALGTMYLLGYGVDKNPVKGFSYVKMAADAKLPGAQYVLGQAYFFGMGTAQNHEQAFVQYTALSNNDKASSTQKGNAQFELAKMYYLGQGVMKSEVTAMAFLELAAGNGHAEAAAKLNR